MKTFANINEENIVTQVIVIDKPNPEEWLNERLGGIWVESFDDGGQRKNPAAVGGSYDSQADVFIPVKPFTQWILNTETYQWEAPIPKPSDGRYIWDELENDWTKILD